MFRHLILEELTRGPKTTSELYEAAQRRQPSDCKESLCLHRRTPTDMEWQHELRREQQLLKNDGVIALCGGRWTLLK